MKKLLAFLLIILMLVGFGAGVSAQTPEEEALEAEGRALLMQTMEDLKGDIMRLLTWVVRASCL